jgi:hypothetical protein
VALSSQNVTGPVSQNSGPYQEKVSCVFGVFIRGEGIYVPEGLVVNLEVGDARGSNLESAERTRQQRLDRFDAVYVLRGCAQRITLIRYVVALPNFSNLSTQSSFRR